MKNETCRMPPELSEDELSALIDGEADARLQDHIKQCPYCAGRLAQAQQLESGLRMALHRHDCPTSFELAQYQMDMLDAPEETARIEAHLKTCVRCREDLRDWKAFVESEDSEMFDLAEDQPDNIIEMPRKASKRVVLIPDIKSLPQRAVRGSVQINRIIATAGETTIRLAFEPQSAREHKLTVQLSSKSVDWREGMVTIRQNAQVIAVVEINAYLSASCILPTHDPVSLQFVAKDETLIDFNNVTP